MLFKTWGYITMTQGLQFTSDFKLGHYMKIPHRPMFWCQIVATVVAGTAQLGVQAWMFSNIEDLCSADQPNGFVCPSTTVFGTASIIVSHCCLLVLPFAQSWFVIVGCYRTAASVLARSSLLRSHFLFPGWHNRTPYPMDITQKVQTRFPEVPQFPDPLNGGGQLASRDTSQLCTLGLHLLHL